MGESYAIDQGGVTKELLTLAIRQLIQETHVLEECNASSSFVWFSKRSDQELIHVTSIQAYFQLLVIDDKVESPSKIQRIVESDSPTYNYINSMVYYLGLLVGLAKYHDVLVDVPLPPFIYKMLMNTKPSLSDLHQVDPILASSLKFLLDCEGNDTLVDIGATFVCSENPLLDSNKKMISIELKDNGRNILVDRSNRQEFVQLFLNYTLFDSCASLCQSFLNGLNELLHSLIVKLCSSSEIDMLISGSKDIGDLSLLRLSTTYSNGFNDEHPIIHWFWEILSDMKTFEKHKFLHFITGSDRVPIGGISKLHLTIQSIDQPSQNLPSSQTCFTLLRIPNSYSNKEILQQKLLVALDFGEKGFGFA